MPSGSSLVTATAPSRNPFGVGCRVQFVAGGHGDRRLERGRHSGYCRDQSELVRASPGYHQPADRHGHRDLRGSAVSCSPTITETVALSPTAVALSSSLPTPAPGSSITLTAQLTPVPNGSPLGTVQFYDGATSLGTVPLSAPGAAIFSVSAISAGPHSYTAVYSRNASSAGLTSPALSVSSGVVATATTLSESPAAIAFGQAETLSAMVAPTPTGAPLGTVKFLSGRRRKEHMLSI